MAKGYGVTALDRITGRGTLNLDLRAAGPIHSLVSGGMAPNLHGTGPMNFHDVRYSGADISHELTAIAGILGLACGFGNGDSSEGASTRQQLGRVAVRLLHLVRANSAYFAFAYFRRLWLLAPHFT